jgi:hypothetical protein
MHTWPFIVILIQKHRKRTWVQWNSFTTIRDTLIDQRHHSNFKIIQGESPKALPLTYKNTKFPSIDDKIKQVMTDQDEALAAHELARARIAERRQNTFTPFTVGQKVWLDT